MLLAITAQRAHVLGFLAHAVESVAARICWEAGGRVATNVFLRDLDLDVHNAGDARRLEVVADGLPLFGGAQLAVDTGEMGLQEQGQREGTVLRWQLQDVQKRGVTLNWWGEARGRGWLCWLRRWGGTMVTRNTEVFVPPGESSSTC